MILLAPSTLPAQADDHAAAIRHRNDCRLAAQVLHTGNPRTRYAWARGPITSCPDEGPAFFAAEWQRSDADSFRLYELVRRSAEWRDARLYAAVRSVASDHNRPNNDRIGAMLVLLRYVIPTEALWFSDLKPPPDSVRHVRLLTASSTGSIQVAGTEPIPGPIGPEVLALLNEIAESEQTRNRTVWYAAAALARVVRFELEAGRGL